MEELLQIIERRHSTKAPFDPKRGIPRQHPRTTLEAARRFPNAPDTQNFEIVVIEDRSLLEAVSAEGAESEVKRLLGVPDALKVAYTARIGYPTNSPHHLRVRRDIRDFVHLNRYGKKELA